MKNDPKRKNTKKANSRKWRAHWKKVVSTLAAITVFCTTYALILPAITVNSNTYCGLEEHEHTEACYTKELICGLTEGEIPGAEGGQADAEAPQTETQTVTETVTETVIELQQVLVDEGHVHQDSCYEETRNLVCGLEETESKEAVLDEEGNVIEEAVEGHTHTDECYQVERVLVCGQEEREPVYEEQEVEVEKEVQKEVEVPVEQPAQPAQPAGEPHVHTDACYKEVLTCGKEEHKHVDECFSNPTLDLETAADWEKMLPKEDELTENWAEDVLTIAKSQLGYKESSRNFKAVNGDRKGYTRYGARFGAPYSDWCAMFIQFAMHYAGVDERLMPGNPSVSKWIENVKKIENYFEPADYTPVPGDIMFIDWDKVVEGVERDGDHIGIVAEVKTTEETTPDGAKLEVPTSIVTIEGNLDNEVKYNTYKIDDERILGYSHMPEKPETEEELEERVEEIEALIEGKELIEGEEGAEGEEPAEGTEEENEEIVVDTIIALASYTESGVQVNFEAPSSVFPEGTVDPALNVVEILPGTPEYDEYFAQAQANAGTEVLNARFFDISVVDLEGNEIKLNDESLAKVEIIFPENETMTTEGNIDVLHFAEEGLEVLESQVQGREEVETITFDTTSFSPYGVIQTPKSGEGSTDGSSGALAEKREKSDGTGYEYVVTSWEALEKLIESGTYKDTDGSEKTSTTLTSIDVVIDGIIAANSQIDTKGKTINLSGINDAKVYVDSEATSLAGGMFLVNGGSFKVDNVVFSGKKATYTAPSLDWSKSNITVDGDSKLSIGGKKLGRNNTRDGFVSGSTVSHPLSIDGSTSGDFRIKDEFNTYYGIGSGNEVRFNESDPKDDEFKWYLSDGVLVNKKYPSCALHMDANGNITLATKEAGGSGSGEGKWTVDNDSNVNDLVDAGTEGFFITAKNGAKVEIKDNTSFQDMIYDATTKNVAPNPIYVTGTGTEFKLNSDTATIKNNRSYIPALKNNDREILYKKVLKKAKDKNDSTWDLNPGGNTYRKSHDDGTKAAGGIFITDSGTVNLIKGTIGGDNTENVNLGNTGIAGAVYIDGGTLNQSGGSIKGNHAFKGAVVVDGEASTYNLTTGSVTKNDSTMHGGGISALNEGNVIVGGEENQTCDGDDVPVISYNRTLDQGGGIYVHSDNVKLRRAKIEHNAAHFMGGGIYVYGGDSKQDDKNSVLIIDDTYVTRNYAGNQAFIDGEEGFGFDNKDWNPNDRTYGEGGGVWSCTYGSFIMNGNEIHIWNNDAYSPGKDFYKHAKGNASGIITEFLADPKDDYYDTKETNNTADDSKFDVSNFTPITGRLSLINKASTSAYETEMEGLCDAVKITDNRAGYAGGGIGSNGIVSYKPLNNQDIYRPEFIFSKSFKNKGSNSSDISTAGKSATFNVTVTNLVNPNEEPAVYTGIVLQDGAKIVDDPNGVDPKGYSVDNWTATITLPQMFKPDGTSIYKEIINKNNHSMGHSQGYYNIDEMIKIVIEEVDMTDGVLNVLNTYDLILGDMTYSYNSPPPLSNYQEDVTITYHDIELVTSLTNEQKNGQGRVKLTKKDKDRDIILSNPENQPEFRISAVDASNVLGNPEGTVISGDNNGVYTTDYLTPGKYAIWESKAPNGYDGLGSDKFIYVNIAADGTPSFVSTTGQADHVVAGNVIAGTSTNTSINDGGTLPITVYNDKHTKLTIAKVDKDGNPIKSASTKFMIMTFDGETFISEEFTLDATGETNYYEIANEAVETFFSATNLNLGNANFFLKETAPPSNRYNALDTVIPFRVRKVNGNNYQFIPMTLKQVNDLGTTRVTKGADGKTFTIVATQDKIKFASTSNNETQIEGVTITSGEGSLTYQVQNEMKPIEIKVAKLDENGNPLPGARFTIRPAENRDTDMPATPNNPDDGVYKFANTTSQPNYLQKNKSYSIWEASAPDGYVTLGLSVMIDIDEHGKVTLQSDATKLADSSKYLLDGTAEQITSAISAGIISLNEDENGLVTISIKNYPTEDLKVEKVWDDNDNQNNTRPSAITVDLYANLGDGRGVVKVTSSDNITSTPTLTLNSGNTWSGEWQDLPSYRNGTKISYSVKESNVPDGYISAITYEPATETTTCPTATGVFTGKWQEISVADLASATNGFRIRVGNHFYFARQIGGALETASVSQISSYYDTSGNPKSNILWTASNLSSYYNANNGYRYYFFNLKNVGMNNYFSAYNTTLRTASSPERFGYVASRMYVDEKYYDGYSYTYRYVDGDLDTKQSASTTSDIPTLHFEVPVYGDVEGECETTINPAKYIITNTWKDTIDLKIEKAWTNVSADHPIPETLTVTLYRNGEKVKDITLSAANNWKHTETGLRKYDENNLPYEYSIAEETVDYYVLDAANSTTSISSNDIANGETVESWTDVSYKDLSSTTDGFRIVVDNYVYYLDTSGTTPVLRSAPISSNRPEFRDSRSAWTLTKYEKYSAGYIMQFQSKYDASIYIGTSNSRLIASSSPRDFYYQTSDGEMWWRNGTDMGWFSGDIANNSCRARFVQTQKAHWKESGSLKLTNKYEPHAGLELIKVDENNASSNWTTQAEFTLYHMRGEKTPIELTLSDGKYLLESIPTDLIPPSGGDNCFFIVETKRPTQDGKEYAQLGTAIPISINTRGEVKLITAASQYQSGNFFVTGSNYNATTKMLVAAGNRPELKVDFDQIGAGKAVSATKDDNRIVITAKNTPINNELELVKIDNSTSEGKVDGAAFSIKNESTGSYVSPAEGGWWTTSDGKWKVSNLAPGTYTIKEESAPKNYIKSNATVTVVVDEYTGKITVTPSDTNVVVGVTGSGTTSVSFKFINVISSYELPEAGGIGTTILYIAGAILVIGAGVLLIVRRKMNK